MESDTDQMNFQACDEAFDRLRHQGLQDGVMDIILAWEMNDGGAPNQR